MNSRCPSDILLGEAFYPWSKWFDELHILNSPSFVNGGKRGKDHHPPKLLYPFEWYRSYRVQMDDALISDAFTYMSSHIFCQTLDQTLVFGLRTVTALGSEMISLQETWSHGDHHPFTSDVPRYQISTSFLLTLGNQIPKKQPKKQPRKEGHQGDLYISPWKWLPRTCTLSCSALCLFATPEKRQKMAKPCGLHVSFT